MAARRLAISSLLCADDPPQPQHTPPDSPYPPPQLQPPFRHSPAHVRSTYLDKIVHHSPPPDASASPRRDVVPLSMQPVHLRRHTPSPSPGVADEPASRREPAWGHARRLSDRGDCPPDVLRPAARPASDVYPAYSSHAQRSPDPLPSHPRRTSDPSYGLTQAFPRPHSARSAHSDSPPASYHLSHNRLQPPHSLSPSRSPSSPYTLPLPPQRTSPHSPILLTVPVSSSSAGYYPPLTPSVSYQTRSPSAYHPTIMSSPHILPGSTSPPSHAHHIQSTPSRVPQPARLSSTHSPTFSPATSASSSAHLPNLLNAAPSSPVSPSSGDMGGLEALVQAATEERRRLSGEMPSAHDLSAVTSPRASRSPVVERIPAHIHVAPPPNVSPIMPRLPTPPSTINLEHSHGAQPKPASFADTDSEPLPKRRRRSGSFDGSASRPSADLSPARPRDPILPGQDFLSRTSNSEGAVTTDVRKVAGLEEHVDVKAETSDTVARTVSVLEDDHRQVAVDGMKQEKAVQKVERVVVNVKEQTTEKKTEKRRDSGSKKEKGPARTEQQVHPPSNKKQLDKKEVQEEDPHEWLLEHYSAVSPPAQVPDEVDATSSPLKVVHPDVARYDKEVARSAAYRDSPSKKKRKRSSSSTRTPSPLAILEKELEEAAKPLVIARTTPLPGNAKVEMSPDPDQLMSEAVEDHMDLDVEDELLSLVDDKPARPLSSKLSSSGPATSWSKQAQGQSVATKSHAHTQSSKTEDERDRESMPPPSISVSYSKEGVAQGQGPPRPGAGENERATSIGAANAGTKKKEGSHKPTVATSKTKHPSKSKAKPSTSTSATGGTKSKHKTKDASASLSVPGAAPALATSLSGSSTSRTKKGSPFATSAKRPNAAINTSRSRSTSVMPVDGEEEEKEDSEEGADDDKLYCVCKTSYDEERVMIACDRCDEWYHTQCVNMPDLEVDLVDQFICPPCVESNPHLSLKTTYKKRCLNGLRHPKPDTPNACHKPARGILSKYCSEECGVQYMQSRIERWGGERERLWDGVKGAEKREGVVVKARHSPVKSESITPATTPALERAPANIEFEPVLSTKPKPTRDLARLHASLATLTQRRETLKREMDVVLWREKLVELASRRAEGREECGWDQRVCFGDEEWAEFGDGVLESYEEGAGDGEEQRRGAVSAMGVAEGEWWCTGKKKCDRHAGWQKLRSAEVQFEKEAKEAAIAKLTTQERELRRRIEDVMDPNRTATTNTNTTATTITNGAVPPLQPHNGKVQTATEGNGGAARGNGTAGVKVNGVDHAKKGKKKKS